MARLPPSPLGQLLYEPDRHHVVAQFRQQGRFVGLTEQAVRASLDSFKRETSQLRGASGRWRPGKPDPQEFVPGDVPAVRVGAGKPILLSGWRAAAHDGQLGLLLEPADLHHHPMKALDLLDLTAAVPYFIPTVAALGVLASRPPDPQLQSQLRLPFQRVFVLFGADLGLDPSVHRWPADYPYQRLPPRSITYQPPRHSTDGAIRSATGESQRPVAGWPARPGRLRPWRGPRWVRGSMRAGLGRRLDGGGR